MDISALSVLTDFLKPTSYGEPVNVHVVVATPELRPDFDAMQRILDGKPQQVDILNSDGSKRTIPENR